MGNILDKIFAEKKEELANTRRQRPLPEIKSMAESQVPCLDVMRVLDPARWNFSRIIAELKRRTPFKGEVRADFDPVAIA